MFVYFSFGKTALSGRYLLSVGKKGILDIVGTTDNCLIYQGDLFVAVLFIRFSVFTKFCIFYVQLGNPKPLASVDLDCFYSSLGEVTCDKRFSVQKSTLVCNQKKKKINGTLLFETSFAGSISQLKALENCVSSGQLLGEKIHTFLYMWHFLSFFFLFFLFFWLWQTLGA